MQIEVCIFRFECGPRRQSWLAKCTKHFAVVDVNRNFVFAMVTKNYELITNEQAMTIGHECFQTVFEQTDVSEMKIYNTVMSKNRSICHVDYVHPKAQYNNYFEKESWTPFLRITNSYNRTRQLQFHLGFCAEDLPQRRHLWQDSITFKRDHSRSSDKKLKEQFILHRGTFPTT